MKQEQAILESWHKNAAAWSKTIAAEEIESRKLVTNKAIIDCVTAHAPQTVLDLGCGEGWLVRALQPLLPGARFTGIDAIEDLVETARKITPTAEFYTFSYQQVIAGAFIPPHAFDLVAINFALFGDELVEQLLGAIKKFLAHNGVLVIQTLHPHIANGNATYADGWREGSWNGFSEEFSDPAPWYFRTIESWVTLFSRCGLSLNSLREPLHPVTGKPASIIFELKPGLI